jgi:hypothetical protein
MGASLLLLETAQNAIELEETRLKIATQHSIFLFEFVFLEEDTELQLFLKRRRPAHSFSMVAFKTYVRNSYSI